MFHFQININCKECVIVTILIFLNSRQCICPKIQREKCLIRGFFWSIFFSGHAVKNTEKAPAQAMNQLRNLT